ncbi:MAG: DUF4900 domain-containing protein [Syntrophomonadaceae bacterium]|nr:DUF4900 domain-containing protein [Syntrophomonadaceae bacterium]
MRYLKSTITSVKNQHGATLPMVLIVMVLMVILSAAAYQVSQGNTGIIAMASSSEKALYAAEQGYNRTLWRLNNEKTNFLVIEDASPDQIQYGGKDYNRYELTAGPNYRVHVLVPLIDIGGSTDEDNYRRIIRSTGWDSRYPERLRSIEVEVYKKTFTQFCMANDSERDRDGNPLYWVSGEVVYGPLHTNDTLYVSGTPVFHGPVTYVNGINISPSSNLYNPAIFRKGHSQIPETLSFNSSLSNLKANALIDGHYYNGRTCIYLLENGGYNIRYYDQSTGRWYYNGVEYRFRPTKDGNPANWLQTNLWWSWEIENERADNSSDIMFQKVTRDNDGNIISIENYRSFADLAATVPSLALPANGVIYVDGNTGGGSTGDSAAVSKFGITLGNVFVSGKLDGRLTIAAANNIFIASHDPCDWRKPSWSSSWYDNPSGVTYSNTDFNQVFENGEWSHTEVTGSSGEDMLGLVATNNVTVMHYNWPSQYHNVRYRISIPDFLEYDDYCYTFMNLSLPVDHAPDNIYLHAAIYAQEESFGFEAYDRGRDKDTCYVAGSIAQKYRGPQGVSGFLSSAGYKKNYSHDPRLLYDSPPHYPDPANSGWQSSHWSEIKDHIN